MHVRSLVFCLILALSGQLAPAAGCDGPLRAGTSPYQRLQIAVDPVTHQLVSRPGHSPLPPAPSHIPAPSKLSLGQHFHQLMLAKSLLKQNDPQLAERDLIVEGGGLCGTACATNVLRSMLAYVGDGGDHNLRAADYLHLMIDWIRKHRHVDARRGVLLEHLGEVMYAIASPLNLKIQIEHHPMSGGPIRLEQLNMQHNELLIVNILTDQMAAGKFLGHALAVLAADPDTGRAAYSDPNDPNTSGLVDVKNVYDSHGRPSVKFYLPYLSNTSGYSGITQEYLRIRVMN